MRATYLDPARRLGMAAVGAGGSIGSASAPRVVERLGLKVAFVGFSNILPTSGVEGSRLAPAVIEGTRPRLLRR